MTRYIECPFKDKCPKLKCNLEREQCFLDCDTARNFALDDKSGHKEVHLMFPNINSLYGRK